MKTNNKKMLILSIMCIIICVSLLLGTTFAWFTDSTSSGNNIISSGSLDIELQYYKDGSWKDIKGKSDVLTTELWEPGVTEVAYLRLANVGTLAFKYNLAVNILAETKGINAAGEVFALSDYIYYDVATLDVSEQNPFAPLTKEQATDLLTQTTLIKDGYYKDTYMLSGDEMYVALLLHMPSAVGNEANYRGETAPTIELGINVFATQHMFESDSFNNEYDKYTAAFSVEEAEEMFATNADFTLVNCSEEDEVLTIPASYTGSLTLMNVKLAGIVFEDSATQWLTETGEQNSLEIRSNVVVVAKDNASAITGKNINIYGDGTLTAVANGTHAFGIGGMTTQSINISDVTIAYVEGGEAYGVGSDTKYYKDAPEGGAAIGSAFDGAVIALDNVTIKAAIGGSKCAAIGAFFHTGVQINIANSTIEYAEGGVTAAAIGSSRVSNGASESGTTISITNSTIKAVGGAYGAGIGSGYDTHCQAAQPLCTINVVDSTITAIGGRYSAGVGTGYHMAALAGEIVNSTVDATPGEAFYKDSYTTAEGVGFGVVDPAREGTQTGSYIIYNGTTINIGNGL